MDLKNKLIKALFLSALVVFSLLFLLIVFQPNNIFIFIDDPKVLYSKLYSEVYSDYVSMFGWVGIIYSIPLAWFLVQNFKPSKANKKELVFHYLGVFGTRACVVVITWLLFAIAGYCVPNHIVNFNAFETYEEQVDLLEYRVSTGSDVIRKNRSWYSFPDEFLVIKDSKGNKIPLNINNTFASNKLDVSAISSSYEQPAVGYARYNVLPLNKKAVLIGRRYTLGHIKMYTIDAIRFR